MHVTKLFETSSAIAFTFVIKCCFHNSNTLSMKILKMKDDCFCKTINEKVEEKRIIQKQQKGRKMKWKLEV